MLIGLHLGLVLVAGDAEANLSLGFNSALDELSLNKLVLLVQFLLFFLLSFVKEIEVNLILIRYHQVLLPEIFSLLDDLLVHSSILEVSLVESVIEVLLFLGPSFHGLLTHLFEGVYLFLLPVRKYFFKGFLLLFSVRVELLVTQVTADIAETFLT
jgi:hypothetical protein